MSGYITVHGQHGMSVTIVAHSYNVGVNKDIVTFVLEYPRFIHAEFMTHRVFSRNAASSRAIPIKEMIANILNRPATPVHWGANQGGMQAKAELTGWRLAMAKLGWRVGMRLAVGISQFLSKVGLHKQIANRGTEPYQMMRVVATATELSNFFYLRDHPDAQPEFAHLAGLMSEALRRSHPRVLQPEEWHMPFFRNGWWSPVDSEYTLEQALKISASCCAQVSYRKSDDSLQKAEKVWDRLVATKPVHASPFEHQARPMQHHAGYVAMPTEKGMTYPLEAGVTHVDRDGKAWSGNFKGWLQHRQLIPGHVKE